MDGCQSLDLHILPTRCGQVGLVDAHPGVFALIHLALHQGAVDAGALSPDELGRGPQVQRRRVVQHRGQRPFLQVGVGLGAAVGGSKRRSRSRHDARCGAVLYYLCSVVCYQTQHRIMQHNKQQAKQKEATNKRINYNVVVVPPTSAKPTKNAKPPANERDRKTTAYTT